MLRVSQACMTVGNVTIISGFLIAAAGSGRRLGTHTLKDLVFALILGMGLIVNTTTAFLTGCFEKHSVFERTPKQGSAARRAGSSRQKLHWTICLETLFFAYMCLMTFLLIDNGRMGHAMSSLLFVVSTGFVVIRQLIERFMPSDRSIHEKTPASDFAPERGCDERDDYRSATAVAGVLAIESEFLVAERSA